MASQVPTLDSAEDQKSLSFPLFPLPFPWWRFVKPEGKKKLNGFFDVLWDVVGNWRRTHLQRRRNRWILLKLNTLQSPPPSGFDSFLLFFISSFMISCLFCNNLQLLLFYFELRGFEVSFLSRFQFPTFSFWFPFYFLFFKWIFPWLCLSRKVLAIFRQNFGPGYAEENIFVSSISILVTMNWWGSEILSDLRFFRSNSLCCFLCLFQVEWNGMELNWVLFYQICILHYPVGFYENTGVLMVIFGGFKGFGFFPLFIRTGIWDYSSGFVMWIWDGFVFKRNRLGYCTCNFGSFWFHDFRIVCLMGRFILYLVSL